MEKIEGTSSTENPRPWQSYHTVYTNAKAGMDGVDKEKVQRVVYEMSKGSKYFDNEERKEAFIRQKIEHMRVRCAKLTAADLAHYQKVADKRVSELEVRRDLSRIWLHVDMDAFYAAVETLSDPSLKGKPMAVGGMSMISTANYEARKFGVRAAMPGFIACKLCPELIFVPTDFKKYNYYSDLTRKVFRNYDPNFMAASLDEAYLDITEVCRERGITSAEIAEELRSRVYEETGLTCSAGVAANRLLAKVCSDVNKPNGQFVLPNERMAVITFVSSLPIRKIGGIGKVTEHMLRDVLGINTCEELLQKGSFLCALFSQSTAEFFLSVGLGLGGTETPQVRFRKSISNERTFSATEDKALLYQKLAEIAEMLSSDMHKEGLHGRTLTLKLKTASFEVRTRAVTLQKYICSSEDILKHASLLLEAELPVSLRLIGLRVSQFNEDKVGAPSDPRQRTLTNFIMSGNASRKNAGDQSSLGSDISDYNFMDDQETSFSLGIHEAIPDEFRDPFENNCVPNVDDKNHTFSDNVGEVEKTHQPSSSETAGKGNKLEIVRHTPKSHQNEVSQLMETDSSFLLQHEGNNHDRVEEAANIPNNEAKSSSNPTDQFFWVDNYKCSLCGTELPPTFVEERQEHSDFHLAARLQEEESGTNTRFHTPTQRPDHKDRTASASHKKRKKLKYSRKEGTHIPIDTFFVKSNQNF
ncbi:hypothetical protein Ddye_003449 [Dipteronia dyeriana]|uniref:DNA polymerase kappa n=1 Tax=Dipteronia dyeriana TaxID=168575 RepID=A0AAD9XSS3_9ROSI|nr:hypothetical protein Ddye_003449 [Dipteronia dyeriana]